MKQLIFYYLSNVFILLPVAAVRPMMSLFAIELGASMIEIGILTACYSLTPLFLAVPAGRFIDQFGEKIPLLIGSLGITFALIIPFFLPHLPFLFLSILLLGGSQFLAFISIQNGVIKTTFIEKRNQAIAMVSLFGSVGLMLGPLIGGYSTEHLGFQNSFLFYCIFSILLLFLVLFVKSVNRENVHKKNQTKQKVNDLLSIPGIKRNIIISMLILASLDIFYVYYPLFASSKGLTPSEIGWILSIQSFASVITRLYLSKVVERLGIIKTIFIFMFSGAIAYSLIPLFDFFIFVAVMAGIVGFGLGIVQPLTIMIAYNLAPSNRTAEVLGIRLAANRLSQVVIPLVFSVMSISIGVGSIFVIQGIILGIGAIFAKGIKIEDKNEELIAVSKT
ncbi:MFS transporter [Psychrobacillus sp. NPDC093180]|uniref:MFS transporter n=1 Tax=Psychrobacillus sp. NPDC093180 TaxID=3364489 RepID=UPI00380397CB